MGKPKYEKPVVKNLSSLSFAQGSCRSGNPQYAISGPCTDGAEAGGGYCSQGTVVIPWGDCSVGNDAGDKCVSGYTAG